MHKLLYSQPNFAGLSFAYQILYLLDATGFYSLGLHALGIQVCRATGQELVHFLVIIQMIFEMLNLNDHQHMLFAMKADNVILVRFNIYYIYGPFDSLEIFLVVAFLAARKALELNCTK